MPVRPQVVLKAELEPRREDEARGWGRPEVPVERRLVRERARGVGPAPMELRTQGARVADGGQLVVERVGRRRSSIGAGRALVAIGAGVEAGVARERAKGSLLLSRAHQRDDVVPRHGQNVHRGDRGPAGNEIHLVARVVLDHVRVALDHHRLGAQEDVVPYGAVAARFFVERVLCRVEPDWPHSTRAQDPVAHKVRVVL